MTDFPNVAASAEDCTAAADDRQAEPAQPQLPVPDEPAAVLEQFQTRIDELTQERDQARRELDQALQNLELARSVQPRAVGPDNPSRCSVCLKQRSAVKAMFTNPRRYHQFYVCNECISEMHQRCNEIIAKGSPALDASRCRHDKVLEPQQGRGNDHHAESFWVQDDRSGGPAQTKETRA